MRSPRDCRSARPCRHQFGIIHTFFRKVRCKCRAKMADNSRSGWETKSRFEEELCERPSGGVTISCRDIRAPLAPRGSGFVISSFRFRKRCRHDFFNLLMHRDNRGLGICAPYRSHRLLDSSRTFRFRSCEKTRRMSRRAQAYPCLTDCVVQAPAKTCVLRSGFEVGPYSSSLLSTISLGAIDGHKHRAGSKRCTLDVHRISRRDPD